MRELNRIIIHHTDTFPYQEIGVAEIRHWHITDNGWRDIGYHYVIRRTGAVESGRPLTEIGAHAKGHNRDSIGVALVGGRPELNFTRWQWRALEQHVIMLCAQYGIEEIVGHRDVGGTNCPGFDVRAWMGGK